MLPRTSPQIEQLVNDTTPNISTIIPFCDNDKHLVEEAIQSILNQTVQSSIYVIGDAVNSEDIRTVIKKIGPKPYLYYYIAHGVGPYNITNSIVSHHTRAPIIALQDADDISLPTRLECQLEALTKVDHCCTAMKQIAMPDYIGKRHLSEPTLLCGVKASNVPMGRYINSTRTFRRELFNLLNGFPDMLCSGDLCFDNTINALKVPSFAFSKVLAIRRLHSASLTNNPQTNRGAPIRKACMERLKKNLCKILRSPTIETAKSIGGLHNAPPLMRVV